MNFRIKSFLRDSAGLAATEFALILPVMLALLLGLVDVGTALLLGKKNMAASQIVADLLTRQPTATDNDVTDALAAARMAVQPYDTDNLGVDIISIQFQGVNATPTVLWRETVNMDPIDNVDTLVAGLGVQGEGVLVVATQYIFDPLFTHGVLTGRNLTDVAITRPRRGSFIARDE